VDVLEAYENKNPAGRVFFFNEKTISQKGKEKENLDSVFLSGAPFPALGLRVRRAVSRSLR
jgi:hypothetical protein